jgi:hypothetical protein
MRCPDVLRKQELCCKFCRTLLKFPVYLHWITWVASKSFDIGSMGFSDISVAPPSSATCFFLRSEWFSEHMLYAIPFTNSWSSFSSYSATNFNKRLSNCCCLYFLDLSSPPAILDIQSLNVHCAALLSKFLVYKGTWELSHKVPNVPKVNRKFRMVIFPPNVCIFDVFKLIDSLISKSFSSKPVCSESDTLAIEPLEKQSQQHSFLVSRNPLWWSLVAKWILLIWLKFIMQYATNKLVYHKDCLYYATVFYIVGRCYSSLSNLVSIYWCLWLDRIPIRAENII